MKGLGVFRFFELSVDIRVQSRRRRRQSRADSMLSPGSTSEQGYYLVNPGRKAQRQFKFQLCDFPLLLGIA